MATLALSVAGAAIGSTLLPTGVAVLGTTISGAVIGSQIGALAGAYVDQALFASSGQPHSVSGPRLSDLKVTGSTEGAAVPRLFGRARRRPSDLGSAHRGRGRDRQSRQLRQWRRR